MIFTRASFLSALIAALTTQVSSAPFQQSSIAVFRVGDSTSTLTNTSSPVFIDEYSSSTGTKIQTIPLPCFVSGTAVSEGQISTSSNGAYLLVPCVQSSAAGVSTSGSPRVIYRINSQGVVELGATITDAYQSSSLRSVASVDGTGYWTSGSSSGVRYVEHGSTSASVPLAPTLNGRNLFVKDSDLYVTSSSNNLRGVGVFKGLPKTAAAVEPFLTTDSSSSIYAPIVFPSTVFLASDASSNPGVLRYDLSSTGTWIFTYAVTKTAVRGLAGRFDEEKNEYILVGSTTSGSVLRVVEPLEAKAAAAAEVVEILASANVGGAVRGVSFVPGGKAGSVPPPLPPSTATTATSVPTSVPTATTATTTRVTTPAVPVPTGDCKPTTIEEIQGDSWRTKLTTACNVKGIITQIRPRSDGFYISSTNSSAGILVFTSTARFSTVFAGLQIGDLISIGSASVSEFRASASNARNDNTVTQLTNPADIRFLARKPEGANVWDIVKPKVLGEADMPTVVTWDGDEFDLKETQVVVDAQNAKLDLRRGLDFWESLEGSFVHIPSPQAIAASDRNNNFFVVANMGKGSTGQNSRGGLTLSINPSTGIIDTNPDRIQIGNAPGKKNPLVSMGDTLSDIYGVVDWQMGKWQVIPLDTPTLLTSNRQNKVPPTSLVGTDCKLTVGNYNVENLNGTDAALPKMDEIGVEVFSVLRCPDIIGLQEIQDNTGAESGSSDGVTSATQTLTRLAAAIKKAGCPSYSFTNLDPFLNQEGGQPKGNIRPAYLYNPLRVSLSKTQSTVQDSKIPQEVVVDADGKVNFKYNPGRIDPDNAAWDSTRRPLAVAFEFRGERIFMINNHFSSKGGSDPAFGVRQPPTNGAVEKRLAQAKVVRLFIDSIYTLDPTAKVIVQGDLNEFQFVDPIKIFTADSKMVELLEATQKPEERYTYNFDGQCQALDHFVVSSCMVGAVEFEPLHVNTWFPVVDGSSDHDPEVMRFDFCNDSCKRTVTTTPGTAATTTSSSLPTGTTSTTATTTVTRGPFSTTETATVTLTTTSVAASPTPSTVPACQKSIAEIQGDRWRSELSYACNIEGVITNIRPRSDGFYIAQYAPDSNPATSDGIQVFTTSAKFSTLFAGLAIGDRIRIESANVTEFRSTTPQAAFDNTVTQLTSPVGITLLEKKPEGKKVWDFVKARELGGADMPTKTMWNGNEFDMDAPKVIVDANNDKLDLTRGLDFWESIEGSFVYIPAPQAIAPSDNNGNFYVVGNLGKYTTGLNSRGGITLSIDPATSLVDGNPDRIQIAPAPGKRNPLVSMGDTLKDIYGVVEWQFGKWAIIPIDVPEILVSKRNDPVTPSKLVGTDCQLTVGNYNVENLNGTDAALPKMDEIAAEISGLMRCPDIVGLQEIQDDTGVEPTVESDGVTSASQTLTRLIAAITKAGCPAYNYTQVDPFLNLEGGAPKGNIRPAYLYNPLRVSLSKPEIDARGSDLVQQVVVDAQGLPMLKYNPGRIEPNDIAWNATRRPLAVAFEFRGERLFMINNHFSSKGGSDPAFGVRQPPTNGAADRRLDQATLVRKFVDSLYAVDPNAKVIVQGDLNEFQFVKPVKVFTADGKMTELLEAKYAPEERYTYTFDGHCQALDHFVVSSCMVDAIEFEPLHVNTWFPRVDASSDHDPEVMRFDFCSNKCGKPTATTTPGAAATTTSSAPGTTSAPLPTTTSSTLKPTTTTSAASGTTKSTGVTVTSSSSTKTLATITTAATETPTTSCTTTKTTTRTTTTSCISSSTASSLSAATVTPVTTPAPITSPEYTPATGSSGSSSTKVAPVTTGKPPKPTDLTYSGAFSNKLSFASVFFASLLVAGQLFV
ncbi:hypothetical protein HDV05_004031 [Chytridiales sp. JEL 0842]|nr:hypothetical protein HDV05_004031 [Chytridiales sp. JEL 0842]